MHLFTSAKNVLAEHINLLAEFRDGHMSMQRNNTIN